ncbi:MAG: hypothetical protein ACFFAO_06985 [Candidatus Hermodarchaeota archaeon]
MNEEEKNNLYMTFKAVIEGIIEDKKKNPKNLKLLNNFDAKINIGLQTDDDEIFWLNLIAHDGNYNLEKGKLEEYDLDLMADPEDMMYFSNREYSTLHMMLKKNRFGDRKLKFKAGTTGRNMGKLLKLSKILVLDKK